MTYTYDGNLQRTSARYFDANGNPFNSNMGYASVVREYSSMGQLLWEMAEDAEGKLVNAGGQYAAQVHTYDYTGHLIEE